MCLVVFGAQMEGDFPHAYQQDTTLMCQTLFLICKRPRRNWDPTLWEVPLQVLLSVCPECANRPKTALLGAKKHH